MLLRGRLLMPDIAEMTISDELFVNGRDANFLPHLFPQEDSCKPVAYVRQQHIISKINSHDKLERHYRVVRIPMWGGRILLSVYYRFLVISDNLFCEARFFMLPPLHQKYLRINNIPSNETRQELANSIFQSLIAAAFSWIVVLSKVFNYIQGGFASERKWLQQLKKDKESDRLGLP